jgi:hypothetical protein
MAAVMQGVRVLEVAEHTFVPAATGRSWRPIRASATTPR